MSVVLICTYASLCQVELESWAKEIPPPMSINTDIFTLSACGQNFLSDFVKEQIIVEAGLINVRS